MTMATYLTNYIDIEGNNKNLHVNPNPIKFSVLDAIKWGTIRWIATMGVSLL